MSYPYEIRTSQLTSAERLRIGRRRQNLTQQQMAQELGMPLNTYKKAEAGEPVDWDIPVPSLGQLSAGESLMIRRRRTGMTIRDLAEAAGLSVGYIVEVEKDRVMAPNRLLQYWADAVA